MNQYKNLIVEMINSKVVVLKVNRPQARNALDTNLIMELSEAVAKVNAMEEIAVVILTGVEKVFIAGVDIKDLIGISVSQAFQIASKMKALRNEIIHSSKLFIAAINGYCLGGGLELALVCDIRIAQTNAKFGLPEINLGIIPGGGGVSLLSEIVGSAMARKMIFTGEIFSAHKAMEVKIISDIFEHVLEEGVLLAQSLSLKSQTAIAAAKRVMNSGVLQGNEVYLEKELYEFSFLFDYPDSVEGMGAFLEKRKPSFKN